MTEIPKRFPRLFVTERARFGFSTRSGRVNRPINNISGQAESDATL